MIAKVEINNIDKTSNAYILELNIYTGDVILPQTVIFKDTYILTAGQLGEYSFECEGRTYKDGLIEYPFNLKNRVSHTNISKVWSIGECEEKCKEFIEEIEDPSEYEEGLLQASEGPYEEFRDYLRSLEGTDLYINTLLTCGWVTDYTLERVLEMLKKLRDVLKEKGLWYEKYSI